MGKKSSQRVRIKQAPNANKSFVNPFADLAKPPEELINHPASKPDSNISYPWPLETSSFDWSKFIVIYPNYLDSNKTYKQGRRIGKEQALAAPSVQEISGALKILKLRHVVQPYKSYSRDVLSQWENQGRILVDLSSDKQPRKTSYKRQLCIECGRIIPKLSMRIRRLEEEEQLRYAKEEEAKAREIEAAEAAAAKAKSKESVELTAKSRKKGKKKK